MMPVAFLPDSDPTMPGVIVDGDNIIPTPRGYGHARTPLARSATFSDELSSGVGFVRQLNGTPRTFVGTRDKLFELGDGWYDQSRAGGYSLIDTRWSFRQYGNATLAASRSNVIQQSTSGGFADIAGSPQAKYLAVCSGFVLAYNLSTFSDGWACSALRNQASWTPAMATQSADGRLFDTAGPITGARELGEAVIVFKERSMYRHRYVGVPIIWASEIIDHEIGAICDEAIVNIGTALAFVGEHDIYIFDGSRPISIGQGIREWFFTERLSWSSRWETRGGFDRDRMLLYWWYYARDNNTGTAQDAIVYNLSTGKWGHVSGYPVTDVLPYAIDSGFGISEREALHVITDGKLSRLDGDEASANIRFGWMGDDLMASTLTKLRPRFFVQPAAASAEFYRSEDMSTEIATGSAVIQEGAFGTKQNAHWHSAKLTMTGSFEIAAINTDLPRPAGKR